MRPQLSSMDLAFPPSNNTLLDSSRVAAVRTVFLEFQLSVLTQLVAGAPRGAGPLDAKVITHITNHHLKDGG